jgi:tRNA-2-methylthio-N6-dimethylallyladenosine synthase
MKYYIHTFGCQQNVADSERIAAGYSSRGYVPAASADEADVVVINTCIVRQQAEDRVYGMVHNLAKHKAVNPNFKIVVTGCLVGAAAREPSGTRLKQLHSRLPAVDEFLPIEEVGFEHGSIRQEKNHGYIVITNGCNNYCTFCIVPLSRGKEISRPYGDIIQEAKDLLSSGYTEITLLGQNVNSYGSDIVLAQKNQGEFVAPDGQVLKPVYVQHLGKQRIPTLFPILLTEIATLPGLKRLNFISANPWDYSDELIHTIAAHPTIGRTLHLPVQSGDDQILKRMNRWYTSEQYLDLIKKIRAAVPDVVFTTDIIVGFPGETEEAFQQTIELARAAKFSKAFIGCYSTRFGTAAAKTMVDDVPLPEKKRRFRILDDLINHRERLDDTWLSPAREVAATGGGNGFGIG